MNGRAYRFATPAQWRSCLVSGAEAVRSGLAPLARFSSTPASTLSSPGAQVPVVAADAELLWRDDAGRLHRAMIDDGVDETLLAPHELAATPRIASTGAHAWAIDPTRASVSLFERDSLARILRIDRLADRVLDLAPDRDGAVLALCERAGRFGFVRIRCNGTVGDFRAVTRAGTPIGFASLPRHGRVLVLSDGGSVVHLFEGDATSPSASLQLASLRPCFRATAIASDATTRWLLAGCDGRDFGGTPSVLVFDANGAFVDAVAIARLPTGVAASNAALLVAHAHGIDIHRLAGAGDSPAVGTMQVITPLLHAPDTTTASRWSRAQAFVVLPPGTSATLRIAPVDAVERVTEVLRDRRMSTLTKREALALAVPWGAPFVLQGNDAASPVLFAAPMHDIATADALVRIDLHAAPGGSLPQLHSLEVSYGTPGLAERMPMVYRRQMEAPGDFLRALVGVLETTSHDTDARIATLGALIAPRTAPSEWLDRIARWLGLPWDDALDVERKRCLVQHAGSLSSLRGTRAGLDTLLRCLLPGERDAPPRYRIVDIGIDPGLVRLGGDACLGSRLPALLTGLPRSAAVLSRRACLGAMRLPCATRDDDPASAWHGLLRIEIVADALGRARVQPWLPAMVAAMVPATARVRLHWRLPATPSDRLSDAGLLVAGDAHARLGISAVAGRARLPAFRSSTLG